MDIIRRSVPVEVTLPVQFSAAINGHDVAIYNVTVGGLTTLFEMLPESSKLAILDACTREVRSSK